MKRVHKSPRGITPIVTCEQCPTAKTDKSTFFMVRRNICVQARRKRCGMAAVAAPKICREREKKRKEERKRKEEKEKRGKGKGRGE